jgi:hypothetical protein
MRRAVESLADLRRSELGQPPLEDDSGAELDPDELLAGPPAPQAEQVDEVAGGDVEEDSPVDSDDDD